MHTLIAARPWLTVIRLPSYAPDLSPAEGVWRWMKRGLSQVRLEAQAPGHVSPSPVIDHLADHRNSRGVPDDNRAWRISPSVASRSLPDLPMCGYPILS
ncbi:transposase [Plantactinospora sp. DSM 117369]